MNRYFFEIAYNGRPYHGWQIQNNARTVQEVVEDCLGRYYRVEELRVTGCGRTDTGVHAKQYYFHVDLKEVVDDDIFRLNKFLPNEIAVNRVVSVDGKAHARFDAIEREYEYWICTEKNPFLYDRAWQLLMSLDFHAMNKAARVLLNNEDFSSFCKSGSDTKTTICDVRTAQWEERQNGCWVFTIAADRFLRNMVRAVVGTLIDVGTGDMTIDEVQAVLEKRERSAAGRSAPAHGLYLTRVEYPYLSTKK